MKFSAVLFVSFVLIACGAGSPAPADTAAPSDSAGPTEVVMASAEPDESSTPSVGSSPLDSPSPASPPEPKQYGDGDVVEVTGDGLAVRQGPGTAYTLLDAARWGDDGVQVLGSPYRLTAGEQLVVGQGPLAIDGRDWYEVRHTDEEIQWTPPGDPDAGIQGWIAANDRDAEFVRLVTESSDPCCFVDSGVGPATTSEVPTLPVPPTGGMRGLTLTIGHADPAGSCDVRVTDEVGEVLLDETVVGWGNPGAWWPGDGGRLRIDSECAWSLRVGIFAG